MSNNDQQQHNIVRPTEAQLRWAQFRCRPVDPEAVRQFYLHPATLADVPGATSADAAALNTTNSGSIVLSQGRKALLHISQRNYEQRKQHVKECGYRKFEEDDDDTATIASSVDALAHIFAESRITRKHKKHNRRFEAAFYAMLKALQVQQEKQTVEITDNGKVWTRPKDVEPWDGNFSDMKWGMGLSKETKPAFTDAMREHLADIAREYYETKDDDDDEVATLIEEFERRAELHPTIAGFVAHYEQSHVTTVLSPQSANLVTLWENPSGMVQQLIATLEEATKVDDRLWVDGRLHQPAFAQLVKEYLTNVGRRTVGFQEQQQQPSHESAFVQAVLRQLEEEDLASVVQGDEQALEQILHRSLETAKQTCLNDGFENYSEYSSAPAEEKRQPNGFLGRMRKSVMGVASFRFGREESVDEQRNQVDAGDQQQQQGQLVGSVSNKVGELFDSLEQQTAGLKEYSAFRRRQSQDPQDDDHSSLSSFRVLPAGIRKVVLGFRSGKSDDELSEHKSDFEDVESEFSDQDYGPVVHDVLLNADDPSVIDTDGDQSMNGGGGGDLASLALSPTLLTKRHQQVIRAVERRQWDQVTYLLSANPWLAEMADVNTNQYVLHKLSYYGAGQLDMDERSMIYLRHPAAPAQISEYLVRKFPSSVYKFDQDGNLPIHMAAAAANYPVIQLLGEHFASGASVRNEDGMLPLHLTILACVAAPVVAAVDETVTERDIIQVMVDLFPGAIAVTDNEGNLPIHTAASVLKGDVGLEIIQFLLDESKRQVENGLRFRTQTKFHEEGDDETSIRTATTASHSSSNDEDDTMNCLTVRNDAGDTPLSLAIQSRAGWEVIDALTCQPAGIQGLDLEENTALHLLLYERYQDPTAALSVLRRVPEAATIRNESGMLPIEVSAKPWGGLLCVAFPF